MNWKFSSNETLVYIWCRFAVNSMRNVIGSQAVPSVFSTSKNLQTFHFCQTFVNELEAMFIVFEIPNWILVINKHNAKQPHMARVNHSMSISQFHISALSVKFCYWLSSSWIVFCPEYAQRSLKLSSLRKCHQQTSVLSRQCKHKPSTSSQLLCFHARGK